MLERKHSSCSVVQSCLTLQPHGLQHARLPCLTISRSLLKFMSIESVTPSNHPILCCPLLLLLSIFPSIRVFSNRMALGIRWAKYWSFTFSPSSESVQFSPSVVSDSLRPHGLQHTRLPCPSPTPRVYSNSCPLSR